MTIQGWLSKAHISCKRRFGLVFEQTKTRALKLTLSNLVFQNSGVILRNVRCFDVVITNCKFVNCREAVVMEQEESRACKRSSLVIADTEFLHNRVSVFVYLFKELFILTISRCVFQGKIGRFKVTSDNRNLTGAVYVKAENTRNRVHVVGLIADSIFHELAHEYNGFALSFKVLDLSSGGNLTFLNNTAIYTSVYGGFKAFLTKVKINSTYGYAIMGSGPPKVMASVEGVKVILDQCILANNRVGIRMATITCQGVMCSPSSQELVVKNSTSSRGK